MMAAERFTYQFSNDGKWFATVAVGLTVTDVRKIQAKPVTRGTRRFLKESV